MWLSQVKAMAKVSYFCSNGENKANRLARRVLKRNVAAISRETSIPYSTLKRWLSKPDTMPYWAAVELERIIEEE